MSLWVALLFCIPIGLLFWMEARWFFRRFLDRYEKRERRAASVWGLFGALLVPMIYCYGVIQDALPGVLGRTIATGFFVVVGLGVCSPIFAILDKEKW